MEAQPHTHPLIEAAYWVSLSDGEQQTSASVWMHEVVSELPYSLQCHITVDPLQPQPVQLEEARLGTLYGSGRLSSDRRSIHLTLHGGIEAHFSDSDGDIHRLQHPFVLRREVPSEEIPPGRGVHIVLSGTLIEARLAKAGRRRGLHADVQLLALIHLTRPVLRTGLMSEPGPYPVPLPVRRLSQAPESLDLGQGNLKRARSSKEARRAKGYFPIRGILRLRSGYRLISVQTTAASPASSSQTPLLLIQLRAEAQDGTGHEEHWLVQLPESLLPLQALPAPLTLGEETVQPHLSTTPGWGSHYIHEIALFSTDNREDLPGDLPGPHRDGMSTRAASRPGAPTVRFGNIDDEEFQRPATSSSTREETEQEERALSDRDITPRAAPATATDRPDDPAGDRKEDKHAETATETATAHKAGDPERGSRSIVWRVPQPVFKRSPSSAAPRSMR